MIIETGAIIGIGVIGVGAYVGEKVLDRLGKPHLKETMNFMIFAGATMYIAKAAYDLFQYGAGLFL